MNSRLLRRIKCAGILSSPVIIGAIMILSLFVGPVAGLSYVNGFTDETPSDGLIAQGSVMPGVRDTIAVIGINLETDTAETLVSVTVEMTDVGAANFDPTTAIAFVYIYYDEPASTNAVWDSPTASVPDTQVGSVAGGAFVGGPLTWSATIFTGAPTPIPVDDSWENQGSDFFIVIEASGGMADQADFNVGIPNSGVTDSFGAVSSPAFSTATIACDGLWAYLGYTVTDTLSVSSDIPGDPYLDDEDTDNWVMVPPFPPGEEVYFNDYPGEGSDQVTTITLSGLPAPAYTENNPYAFYGSTPYFNEDPTFYAPTMPYTGDFSIDYKLTWTEADTNPANGYNSATSMDLILEDRVGHQTSYIYEGGHPMANFQFIQDDDTPVSMVDVDWGGTGRVYYDESQLTNYLPYTDEFNTIRVETNDDWWMIWGPPGTPPGSGFERPASYARYRVGVERDSNEYFWSHPLADPQGWLDLNTAIFPIEDFIDIQTEIIGDTNPNFNGGPYGYYFIEFDMKDDVSNNIRIGDGVPEVVDENTLQAFDSNRFYFKIMQDHSRRYGGDPGNPNGYTVSGTQIFEQAALSVSDLDIPALAQLELYDTEVFIDSSFNGEKHVDVQGTLITGSMANSAGYDDRSAFTHRDLPTSYPPPGPPPLDQPFTFWVRDGATLNMYDTVVEGCGFDTTDQTQDDRGLYIRTPFANTKIFNSEFRENYAGIMIQDGGGAEIVNCEIHNNDDVGIYAINAQSNIEIRDSSIHDNDDQGIFLDGSYALIDNNDIFDNTDEGIRIDSGEFTYGYPGGVMGYADITNNDIFDNNERGIYVYRSFYAPETAYDQTMAFYSGTGNDVDRSLTYTFNLGSLNPTDSATMTFWFWYSMGNDDDDGFQVLYYNRTWDMWLPLVPVGSYDDANTQGYPYGAGTIGGLDDTPGFARYNELTRWWNDGWVQVEFDLSQFAGNGSTTLKFRYGSDDWNYGTGCMIDDMRIYSGTTGAEIWSDSGDTGQGLWTLDGWQLLDVAAFSATETLIQGNWINDNSDDGIYIRFSDVDILDNEVSDNDGEGISFDYFVEGIIDNNIIDDNSNENIELDDWIEATITDNEITDSDGNEGIEMDDYCKVLIDGNYIAENDGDGIDIDNYCDVIITNNELYFNGGNGIDLDGWGTTYYIDNNEITYNEDDEGIEAENAFGLVRSPSEGSYFYWVQGSESVSHSYMEYLIDLSAQSSATLTFQYATMAQPWQDGGFVEYWNDMAGTWDVLYPVEGYTNTGIVGDGLGPYPGYDGYSDGWQSATFDLDMLAGSAEPVPIRFHYVTDGGTTYGGWAVDDIQFTGIPGGVLLSDGAESPMPPAQMVMKKDFSRSMGVWNYITNNIISYNGNEGIELDETFVDINNNVISFNHYEGIEADNEVYAWIVDNEITFNGIDNYYGINLQAECYAEIRGNDISHNHYGAIDIYDQCQVIIDDNLMTYNTDRDVIEANQWVDIEITNNYIAHNNQDDGNYAIDLYDMDIPPIIENNMILENGDGIHIDETEIMPPPSGEYAWHTTTSVYRSSMVLSRSFDLSSLSAGDEATFMFSHWYDLSSNAGGTIQVFNFTSNSWETIDPIDFHDYDSSPIERLSDSAGYGDSDDSWNYEWDVFEDMYGNNPYDGCDDGWIWAQFDLTPWAGDPNVPIRFWFAEDNNPYAGWFIDEVMIPETGFYADFEGTSGDNSGWNANGWDRVKAAGSIADNEIRDNQDDGINMDEDSFVSIKHNIITGNEADGIDIDDPYDDLSSYTRPAAPSGTHMWYSGYCDYADFQLSRTFDLTGYSEVELTFYHWYYIESDDDAAFVEVYSNGEWRKVEPRGTYPDWTDLGGEGYSGTGYEGEWHYAHFDLSEYAGQTIDVRFRLITDIDDMEVGWYIDDITLYGDNVVEFYDDVENHNMYNWNIAGNDIVLNRFGPPKGWSVVETNAIIISDNIITHNGYDEDAGIDINEYVSAIIEYNIINHNGEEGYGDAGIKIDDEENSLSVRYNEIRHNSYGGIYADESYLYGIFQNNIITHNYGTEEDSDSGHGVFMEDDCSGIFVDNYIADNQHAGMFFDGDGDYVLIGNHITNNHWNGIYMYDTGYDNWNYPVYFIDNIITDNYVFDRLDNFEDDEWSGTGLFLEGNCYVHVYNGVYSNNERFGIFVEYNVDEFQWIIDDEAEVENNGMRIYSEEPYVDEEFGGGEIYPVLVADGGFLTLKNVRDFQTWLVDDDEWYGIEVEVGGTLDARDTTFDSWYDYWISSGDYDVPNYVWSFTLPFPGMEEDYFDYGQFDDNDLAFSGGNSAVIFATEIEWGRLWTAAGEYQVNYRTGEVVISPFTLEGTGPTSMTYEFTSKRPLPYIFRIFGSLYMDDCLVVNTTSLYLETTDSVDILSTIFTQNLHGGISSFNSNPTINDCYFNELDFGIFAEGGTLTIGGSGNTFENCVDAVHLTEGTMATIEDNMFDDNIRAITVFDSTVTITDNYITNCADDGLHIVNSVATITGNSISGCIDKAVYLRSTPAQAIMSGNMLSNNYFSIYASDADLFMTSDSIAGSTLEDIYAEDGSQVIALDVTFDRDEVLKVVDSSLVEIQWYTVVEVLDMNANPFQNADVDITSSTPSQHLTGFNGQTPQFITTEYIKYSTSTDDRKPHTINALGNVSSTIYTGSLDVDITASGTYTIVLNLGPTLENQPGSTAFNEDTTLRSAFDMDDLFADDGSDDNLIYWWIGNTRVIITANPDNVVDLTAVSNWYGTEIVEFFTQDVWGETISQNITITVNPVNDPPLAVDVIAMPTNPDDMSNLTGNYTWFDNVEAGDKESGSIINWYRSKDGGLNYFIVEEFTTIINSMEDRANIRIPFDDTNWGEMWYFSVTPGDNNDGLGDEVASNIVTITRIIPDIYIDDVSIDPSDPMKTDELTAELINYQGDAAYRDLTKYQWYRNGEPIDGATLDTLSSDYFSESDTITVEATPFDGYNRGDGVMSSEGVVIANSPPTLESVVILPQQPHTYQDITALPLGYSDPDVGDYTSYLNNTNYYHLYYVFEWWVGGQKVDGITGNTLSFKYTSVGDTVNVTVWPSDGEARGEPIMSQVITIEAIPANEDFDQDGIPNRFDLDDDGDGVTDSNDAFPYDPDETKDFDGDGVGNEEDNDDDNDGFTDNWDFAPQDPDVQWQPWIWFVIIVLVILLIFLAYMKWWRVPKEPKAGEESSTYYAPEPEEETLVEEPVEEPGLEEEELRPEEEPVIEPEEEEITEDRNDLYREIDEITGIGTEEELKTDTETATEEETPKKKRRKNKKSKEIED